MEKLNVLKLLLAIIACEIIGSIGAIFTSPNIPTWYASLTKPVFNPPTWGFAPAWTTLFFLMGISLYLIWTKNVKKDFEIKKKIALIWFGIQFIFNVLWSFLFFGLRNPLFGFIGIVILWITIVITIYNFYKIDKNAAYLLIPYILWVSFASILNFSIMVLN